MGERKEEQESDGSIGLSVPPACPLSRPSLLFAHLLSSLLPLLVFLLPIFLLPSFLPPSAMIPVAAKERG
jgi:hypothetical protein